VAVFRKFTIFLLLSSLTALLGPPETVADVEKFSDLPPYGNSWKTGPGKAPATGLDAPPELLSCF
jgi:hypothetical protein